MRGLILGLACGILLIAFGPVTAQALSMDEHRVDAGVEPASVAVGDFDGNGVEDLVVANENYSNQISVILGLGDGSFAPEQRITAGDKPCAVAVGDFDNDGAQDLALANVMTQQVSVLLGNGDGTFPTEQRFDAGDTRAITVGDFDNNGVEDLAVANYGLAMGPGSVAVLLGQGDGSFAEPWSTAVGQNPRSIAVGHFNNDDFEDLAVANQHSHVSVLLGRGDGTFWVGENSTSGGNAVAVGDFNSDGRDDLAVAAAFEGKVSVRLGLGDGSFAPEQIFDAGGAPRAIAVGDFDGDGVADLAVANEGSDDVSVLLGQGDGSFAAEQRYGAGSSPVSVAVGDFDGDGAADLAVANRLSNDVSILMNIELSCELDWNCDGVVDYSDLTNTTQPAGGFYQDWQMYNAYKDQPAYGVYVEGGVYHKLQCGQPGNLDWDGNGVIEFRDLYAGSASTSNLDTFYTQYVVYKTYPQSYHYYYPDSNCD